MTKIWRRFLARFHLDLDAVCQESVGDRDYHYYGDGDIGWPAHMVMHYCKRCGKGFTI